VDTQETEACLAQAFGNLDWVGLDGRVHDGARIDYLHRYLLALHRAMAEGVDMRGYFQWTLMDNFEWAEGFRARFGLIHVDYATQRRTMKDSAHWYRDVIQSNGATLFNQAGVNGSTPSEPCASMERHPTFKPAPAPASDGGCIAG